MYVNVYLCYNTLISYLMFFYDITFYYIYYEKHLTYWNFYKPHFIDCYKNNDKDINNYIELMKWGNRYVDN